MNIKQLESFICVVERGSFASAAEAQFTTQSTVSARIRELEKYFDVVLFDRSGHRAVLTPKGEELLPCARQLVQLSQQVTLQISDSGSFDGIVRIGAVGIFAKTQLPRLIGQIRSNYPRIDLRIHTYLAGVLLEKLRDGEIDIALVNAPVTEPNIETIPIGHDEFAWMCSPTLGIRKAILAPADLQKWPILSFTEESHHYPIIERWFEQSHAIYKPTVSCNDMDVLARLTADGEGISLLSKKCYEKLIKSGELKVLRTAPEVPHMEFVAAYKRNAVLHPLVQTIATMASELTIQDGPLSRPN
jgi:DNA-binding transcriptional LysR family regulator